MKKYHELATIKNGQEIVGFVLNKGMRAPKGERAFVVDVKTFAEYVANNEVQYFQTVNGIPTVKYTQEELKKVKNIAELYGDEYIKNDAKINYIALANGGPASIAVSFVAMYSLFGQYKVSVLIYSKTAFTREFIQGLRKVSMGGFSKLAENAYLGIVSPAQFIGYLSYSRRGYNINLETIGNFNSIHYLRKPGIGYKNVPVQSIQDFITNTRQLGLDGDIH